MSTDLPNLPTDAQLLYDYLGARLSTSAAPPSGVEVLADLAAYQNQLDRLRAMVREGEASLDAGEGRELDVDALLERVRGRIDAANRG